jgi:Big-like domain-containing protein
MTPDPCRRVTATLLSAAIFSTIAGSASAQPTNVARGCPYTMAPRPNYSLTTDAGDDRQLTDGAYTDWSPMWLRPTTVGWANASPVTIVIDLRAVQPISSVSFHAAAGTAGVEWPRSIFALVSDDGQHYFPMGDLAARVPGTATPPAPGYGAFRYALSGLDTHGRYVAFIVDAVGSYVFADEIEVLAGDPSRVGVPLTGTSTGDLQDFFVQAHMRVSIEQRLSLDLQAARTALAQSASAVPIADRLSRELDDIATRIPALAPPDPARFTTILPLNDLHARIFAVEGEIAQAGGISDLTAWPVNPWDFVRPLDKAPPVAAIEAVSIAAMNGETRAGAVNVSNSTGQPMTVSITLTGLAIDSSALDVQLAEVLWTDTRELTPVADALFPLDEATPTLMIPAGLTRQLWITFSPHRRSPGTYRGFLQLTPQGGATVRVPIELRVLAGTFPSKLSLHIGGWDYTNALTLGLTPGNIAPLIDRMRALGVDSPWASNAVMPPGRYDASGLLVEAPQTAAFDMWIAKWPDASAYFIFVNAPDPFGNVSRADSVRFSCALGQWITFWVDHARSLGIQPSQLVLLLVDEPHLPAQDDRVVAWANALKAAQPAIRIWEDPTYRDPAASAPQLLDVVDIVALKTWLMVQQGASFADFYRQRGQQGQALSVYGASGPARLTDPYTYQRLQAWMAADIGAESSFFWSFADDAGGHSWNEYATTKAPYSPLFLSDDRVTSSKHAEAIREGAEDFEYLAMLRRQVSLQAADSSRSGLTELSAFLASATASVLQLPGATDVSWSVEKDRAAAERVRLAIASAIDRLAAIGSSSDTEAELDTIGRAVPSISLSGGSFLYDGTPHTVQAMVTGAYGASVAGSLSVTYSPGGSVAPTRGGLYAATAVFTSADPDYTDARADAIVEVIEPTTTNVTASSASSTFGDSITVAAAVAGAASTPGGTVSFRVDGQLASSVMLIGGAATVTFDSLEPGIHVVAAEYGGGAGFTASSGGMNHTVVRATPRLEWGSPAALSYGARLDQTQLNATANVPGSFVYTPPAGALLSAGAQQLTVAFAPADTAHYEAATTSALLTVSPARPAIAVAPATTLTYDGSAHPVAATASGVGGSSVSGALAVTYSPGGSSPPVNPGTYSAVVTFMSADVNYSDATAAASITINPAPLVATMTYPVNGAVNADLTAPIQWTSVLNVQAYYLYIGSKPGAKDLVNTGEIQATSYRVTKYLPPQTLYARIYAKVGGVWRYTESSFTAVPLAATITYPANGATNVDLATAVQWTAVPNAQAYYLYVGSALGAKDLVNTGEIQQTFYRIASLPPGQIVYARLWTKIAGQWRYTDITFSAGP